jgi:hypothetical protein
LACYTAPTSPGHTPPSPHDPSPPRIFM